MIRRSREKKVVVESSTTSYDTYYIYTHTIKKGPQKESPHNKMNVMKAALTIPFVYYFCSISRATPPAQQELYSTTLVVG